MEWVGRNKTPTNERVELAGLTLLCESLGVSMVKEWRRDSLRRPGSHQCVSQSRGSSVKCKGRRFIPVSEDTLRSEASV